MTVLWLDTETYSETPITHGTYVYAQNAEVMIATYAIDDGPVQCHDFTLGDPHDAWGLQGVLNQADIIIAHNAMFDRNVLRLGNLKIETPIEKWRCSMVKAFEHGLPGGLDKLCEILRVPQDQAKIKDGHRLVLQFCKPLGANRKLRRATRETHPADWAKFIEYAKADITAMREVWKRLPSWNYGEEKAGAKEVALWHLDQKINDRGVLTDPALIDAAIRATDAEQARLKKQVAAHTDDYVTAATQRDRMLEFIFAEYGVGLADLTKATVTKMLDRPDLDPLLHELLSIRAQASRSSTSKYKAFKRAANSDKRVRGMLQFSGAARTRRDCLAEGTLVRVRSAQGAVLDKPIETVLLSDEVWDGDDWVRHDGVVASGEKDVVTYDGVTATLKHNVYLDGETMVSLEQAISTGAKLWRGN